MQQTSDDSLLAAGRTKVRRAGIQSTYALQVLGYNRMESI